MKTIFATAFAVTTLVSPALAEDVAVSRMDASCAGMEQRLVAEIVSIKAELKAAGLDERNAGGGGGGRIKLPVKPANVSDTRHDETEADVASNRSVLLPAAADLTGGGARAVAAGRRLMVVEPQSGTGSWAP